MKSTLRSLGAGVLAASAYVVLLLVLAGIVRPWQELRSSRRNGFWATMLSAVVHAVVVVLLGLFLVPHATGESLIKPLAITAAVVETSPSIDVSLTPIEDVKPEIKAGADDPTAALEFSTGGGEGMIVSETPTADLRTAEAGTGFDLFKGRGKTLGRAVGELPAMGGGDGDGAGAGDGGDGKKTTFFGTTATGTRFVFIVDASGSMRLAGGEGSKSTSDRFSRARAELIRCLKEMKPNQEYYVIFYNHQTFPMLDENGQVIRGMLPGTLRSYSLAYRWISMAGPQGGTNPLMSIRLAQEMRPDAIFLLSDGVFNNVFEVLGYVTSLPEPRIPIHTLSFVDRAGEEVLTTVARATGGTYTHVP